MPKPPAAREDLSLAAYAVTQGFQLLPYTGGSPLRPEHFTDGIPSAPLSFQREGRRVRKTERGWRVCTLQDGVFAPPHESDFHTRLLDALHAALRADDPAAHRAAPAET